MSRRGGFDWEKFWSGVIVIGIILGILAVAFSIRLLITGGDVGCIFSQDPALCVAVKNGVGG